MFGEHFYVMPVHDQWEVREPNKLDVHAYATEVAAIQAALSRANAMQRASGIATLVRVRSATGIWTQLDIDGRASTITSL